MILILFNFKQTPIRLIYIWEIGIATSQAPKKTCWYFEPDCSTLFCFRKIFPLRSDIFKSEIFGFT